MKICVGEMPGALLKSSTKSAKIMNVLTKGYVCINNENHNNVSSSIFSIMPCPRSTR